ncbi:MAG: DUF559 domain-containing protein [Acidimicrobiia bacterium]
MDHDARAAGLAREQGGIVSLPQARALGFSAGMVQGRVATGRWERRARGVYRIGGAPSTWLQDLQVAVQAAGDGSAVSHRAAADLYELGNFGKLVEMVTPRPRRCRKGAAIVHTSVRLEAVDIALVDGLPATTPTRTLIDLGAVVHPARLEHAVDQALRDGLTSLSELRWRLARLRGRGRRGAGVMARLLSDRDAGPVPESRYEREFLGILQHSGLPTPQLQHEIREHGRFIGRVDAAWPNLRLAVEIDGHRFHATREERAHDARRENDIKLAGWQVLRFTTDQVFGERPEVVRVVTAALATRSRDG